MPAGMHSWRCLEVKIGNKTTWQGYGVNYFARINPETTEQLHSSKSGPRQFKRWQFNLAWQEMHPQNSEPKFHNVT